VTRIWEKLAEPGIWSVICHRGRYVPRSATMVFLDVWHDDLQQAFVARLGSNVSAFVAVDPVDVPIAVAVGVTDQRLPSSRRTQAKLAMSRGHPFAMVCNTHR